MCELKAVVEKLTVGSDDVLFVRIPERVSGEQASHIRRTLEGFSHSIHIVVMDSDIELSVGHPLSGEKAK